MSGNICFYQTPPSWAEDSDNLELVETGKGTLKVLSSSC